MALKEVFHILAMNLPIESDNFDTEDPIPAGRLLGINNAGEVRLPQAATDNIVGIAGDHKLSAFTSTRKNPESSALVIGANGRSTKWTQNRVSDAYNETLASGKMTVYAGGEFYTDQYALENDNGSLCDWTNGDAIYAATDGSNADVPGGSVTVDNTGSRPQVGVVLGGPSALASGVPGTDLQGAMSFGNYLHILLRVQG